MSDEPPPPPLRLRARPRPESETPPEAAVGGEEGKLRLKPKLAVESEPEVAVEQESAESPPPAETPRLKPKLSLEAEPVAEEGAGDGGLESAPEPAAEEPPPEEVKVKLKIKVPGPVAQEPAPAEETAAPEGTEFPAGEEAEPELPPFPVVAPPEEEANIPPVLGELSDTRTPGLLVTVPPFAGSRPAVFKRPRVPAALLAAERRKRILKYAAIAVGGVLLAAAVIGGVKLKLDAPPPTKVPVRPVFVPPVEVVKPVVVQKVPIPVVPPPVDQGERVASTATIELAPGVTATTEMIAAVPNANSAFRSFVASAKISGVYQGANPRAFINGRMVRAGEMVDDQLEIQFDSVDAASRSIVFKDSTGATVSRRY